MTQQYHSWVYIQREYTHKLCVKMLHHYICSLSVQQIRLKTYQLTIINIYYAMVLWLRNPCAVYLGVSSSRSLVRIQLGCFAGLWAYLKAELGENLLPCSLRIVGKIQFFIDCWPKAPSLSWPVGLSVGQLTTQLRLSLTDEQARVIKTNGTVI